MGLALVAVGQRLAGKIPGGQAAQSSSECA
jgi:hypothetical protein